MASPHDMLAIRGMFLREAQSGKAFNIAIFDSEGNEVLRKWLPHSKTKMPDGGRVVASYRDVISVEIPMWLANNEGIAEYYRDDVLDKEAMDEDEYLEEVGGEEVWGGD